MMTVALFPVMLGGSSLKISLPEVKATASPSADQLRHLAWLRDRLDRAEPGAFKAGVLLHCGTHAHKLGDRLHTAPIEHLWRPPPEIPAA